MAQVALIQQTHAGGPCLSSQHKDPQFPGQFSGGSTFRFCPGSSRKDGPADLTCSSLTHRVTVT